MKALFAALALSLLPLAACQTNNTASTPEPDSFQTGRPLGEFIGNWKINGWVAGADSERRTVTGTAKSSREKNYFVRLDLSFIDPATGQTVEGTSLLSQDGNREVDLTSWFSSSPAMRHFDGTMSADGKTFDFQGDATGRTIRLNVINSDKFTADVWSGGTQIESYTFTRV